MELLEYDKEGIWSISLPNDANKITNIINKYVHFNSCIFEGTGGLGGNIISFCNNFEKVVACEIDKTRFLILQKNMEIYNFKNLTLINDDYNNHLNDKYEAYYFDPPWGGPDYKQKKYITFDYLIELINKIRNISNSPIFIKLPINYDLTTLNEYNYKIEKVRNYLIIVILSTIKK
jgi:16S rRNA G966 N2-methylase RsmD